MKLRLDEKEIYELAELDFDVIYDEIQETIFMDEFYRMGEKDKEWIKKFLADCIEFDVDVVETADNTRGCFRIYDGKLIVVRRRKLNLKLLFLEMANIPEFIFGGIGQRIYVVIKALIELFVNVLDGDAVLVFVMLAEKYYREGKKYSNEEICPQICAFLEEESGLKWSCKKAEEILKELVHARIVNWNDGMLMVEDKIYF